MGRAHVTPLKVNANDFQHWKFTTADATAAEVDSAEVREANQHQVKPTLPRNLELLKAAALNALRGTF